MNQIDWAKVLENMKINTEMLIANILGIIFILILARLALSFLTRFTSKVIDRSKNIPDESRAKELTTSMTLLRSAGRYLIYFAAACIIVNQLGYGSVLSNVVTAAGVGALIISLGAQSIIKDVIAGAFIIFERQYAVGDYVKINDYDGTVSSVAMRCTYLRNWKGQQIIIPNGQITTVTNFSGNFNMAVVEIPVPYDTDLDRMFALLREVANRYYEENKEICFDTPNVVGINSFDDSSMSFAIYQKAVKRNHYKIQRDLRVLVKKKFDEEGIFIPFPQVDVHTDQ